MNGRAFYVTDIHGHYAKLMEALECIQFSPNSSDKLYVAADLIDRGPNSVVNGLSVGVTHSCVSPELTWSAFTGLNTCSEIVINSMNQRHTPGYIEFQDPDVSVVVVGHNPIASSRPVAEVMHALHY